MKTVTYTVYLAQASVATKLYGKKSVLLAVHLAQWLILIFKQIFNEELFFLKFKHVIE